MSILPTAVLAIFILAISHTNAAPRVYILKSGFNPSFTNWRWGHSTPPKRVAPKVTDLEPPGLAGASMLADEILYDLKTLLTEVNAPGEIRTVARSALDAIDPDDPKRLLRIS